MQGKRRISKVEVAGGLCVCRIEEIIAIRYWTIVSMKH